MIRFATSQRKRWSLLLLVFAMQPGILSAQRNED